MSPKPETPRRWFHFRLATLLVAGPLIAIVISWVALHRRAIFLEQEAVKAIRAAGGALQMDDSEHVIRVYLGGGQFDDQALDKLAPHLRNLPYLQELDLVETDLSERSLALLHSLPSLRTLYLHKSGISVELIAQLRSDHPDWAIHTSAPDPIAIGLAMRDVYRHAVVSVALLEDGSRLATGTGEGLLQVWTPEGPVHRLQHERRGHSEWAFSIDISPSGDLMASGGGDNAIRIWKTDDISLVAELRGHENDVHGVRFFPDGQRLASVSDDQTVRLWDWCRQVQTAVMQGHRDTIPALAVSPDGSLVATGSRDDTIRLWDGTSGALLRVLQGHRDDVMSLAFDPSGTMLLSGSYDKTARLWDVEDGALLRVMQGHDDWIFAVTYCHDGSRLVTAGGDGLRIWDAADGALLYKFDMQRDVASLSAHPRLPLVAASSAEGNVALWDVSIGALAGGFWTRFGERELPLQLGAVN